MRVRTESLTQSNGNRKFATRDWRTKFDERRLRRGGTYGVLFRLANTSPEASGDGRGRDRPFQCFGLDHIEGGL